MVSDDVERVGGHKGTYRSDSARLRPTPGTLSRFAHAKLTDITVMTASFGGRTRTFEELLSVYLDRSTAAAYLAVYHPSFPGEENGEPDDGPDLCWRRSYWDRTVDLSRARAATDPKGYVVGDTQLDSDIVVTRSGDQPELAAAVRSGIELFSRGVTVTAAKRPDAEWHQITVDVADDSVIATVGFSPLLAASPEVEQWAARWAELFTRLDPARGVALDGPIRVSYRESFTDLLRGL